MTAFESQAEVSGPSQKEEKTKGHRPQANEPKYDLRSHMHRILLNFFSVFSMFSQDQNEKMLTAENHQLILGQKLSNVWLRNPAMVYRRQTEQIKTG